MSHRRASGIEHYLFETPPRHAFCQDFRLAPVRCEDLPHQAADICEAALVEYQHRWSSAAERTAQQTRCSQRENLGEPRDEAAAEGLVHTVLESRGKRMTIAGGECCHQKSGA